MSGFITIYNTDGEPVDEQLIHSLTHTLKFRGPDQQKVWVDGNIGMGHALFKTTFEAEYENQPATIDNKVWITCNARIDDRENLVNKMGMKQTLDLSRTPDSELILHAYRKWGEECLDHLLGDFAFVIWDSRYKKIFCARDRFGMRQLYFAKKNKSFVVCNSLSCMLKHPKISHTLNEKSIGGFLLFGDYTWMDKSMTMFNEITTLLPAHKLVLHNGQIDIKLYWDIPKNIPLLDYRNQKDYIEHFKEVFKQAIEDRIRTPSISISMSGGMDSTAIAATIKQLQQENKIHLTKLNAVTIVYDNLLPCKERYYSNLVAKYLNIPIHYIVGDNYSFLKPSIGTTRPLEIVQPKIYLDAQKKLSQLSRVVLTGDAGDNLIRYPSISSVWKESSVISIITNTIKFKYLYNKRPPLGLDFRRKLKSLLTHNNSLNTSYSYPEWINPDFEKRVHLKQAWNDMWSLRSEQQSINSRHATLQWSLSRPDWNSDDILMESDFTLSEKRDPYLDLRMVEFILALPALPWLFNKHILRESMQNHLPDEIRYRPKTPLGYLDHALAKKSENNWLKTWEPDIKLHKYLKKSEFPIKSSSTHKLADYLASRPIILDTWIQKNDINCTL
ncbi:asparagine synthase-related protein [Sulfurovum sp.]|uniref:asparagine synthase-related protein n=1 Tax=Sulfurovum sp. TaxID=1969726 RepID=UPI0035627A70